MQQQERSHSYELAFYVGVNAARESQQPQLTGDALLHLAVTQYHHARQSMQLDLDEFLQGWANGWLGYWNGIIDERGA